MTTSTKLMILKRLLTRTVLLCCLLTAFPVVAAPSAQQNLLTNPGFEDGTSATYDGGGTAVGWQHSGIASPEVGTSWDALSYGGPIAAASKGFSAHSGSHVFYLEAANATINGRVFQTVEGLDTTLEYDFKIWGHAHIEAADGAAHSNNATIEILITEDNNIIKKSALMNFASANAWQEFTMQFSPIGSGNVSMVMVYINYHPHAINAVAFDSASLVARPRPTAIPPTADVAAFNAQQTSTAIALNPNPPTIVPTATVLESGDANFVPLSDDGFELPPIEADGKMYYTVQAGDTLQRIARLACGDVTTCVDTIKSLNGLSTTVVQLDQRLIIGPLADNPVQQPYLLSLTPESTAPPVSVATEPPALTPTPIAIAEPATPTPVTEAANSSVCITVFDDDNRDGVQQSTEQSVSGVRVRVIDVDKRAIAGERLTTANTSQMCFNDLPATKYKSLVILPETLQLTTLGEWEFQLANGALEQIAFGVQSPDSRSFQLPTSISVEILLLAATVLAAGLLLALLGLVLVMRRR